MMYCTRTEKGTALRLLTASLFLMGLWEGCAAWRTEQKPVVRDGVEYGVTKGTFRGRWWNYYERGCSYLDGGFYDEAERDLQVAIGGRSRDQLWPRTYGLHFIPDYFPNRELGVVYYHQNRIEDSIKRLEESLEQRFSARAAFYLDQARRRWLESTGRDAASPSLEILSPSGNVPVGATQIELKGVARDDTFVGQIEVNETLIDLKIAAPEIPFSQIIPLRPGQNTIRVAITDLTGKSAISELRLTADVDGPGISFDTPVVVPGAIHGVALDPSEVASMRIAGKPAALSPGPDGAVLFNVELARDELQPPLRYECMDGLGNVTRGAVPLDMLVMSSSIPKIALAGGAGPLIPLGNGLRALIINGEILAVANESASADTANVTVEMSNLQDGQQYYMDEIVVALNINAQNPVNDIELNGETIPGIPGRKSMRVSRKIRLESGDNILLAKAVDAQGQAGSVQRTVQRQLTAIEMNKGKLAVAFIPSSSGQSNPQTGDDIEYVLNELSVSKAVQKRFKVVERSLLKEILAEQNLSESLASRSSKLALGKLIPAEMMITARLQKDQESISIWLEGSSTETAVRILPRVDAAGPYSELDRLIEDLGVRLAQELPRAQGKIIDWSSPEVTMDLNANQGIRDSMKCLVFRTEDVVNPGTGESLGSKPVIVCEGLINNVNARFSTAEILTPEEKTDVTAIPIEVGQYAIIK